MLGSEQSSWPGKHFSFSQEKGQATSVLQQYRVSPGGGELCQLSSEVRLGPGGSKSLPCNQVDENELPKQGQVSLLCLPWAVLREGPKRLLPEQSELQTAPVTTHTPA